MNAELAHFLFNYVNGVLYWKNPSNPKRTPIGSVAGSIGVRGYVHIQYNRKIYKAHRIIFLMFNGYMSDIIDHIDGNISNNRHENLRAATYAGNAQNARKRADNSSGVKNVCWHRRLNKWGVSLSVNGKIRHFGYFEDLEIAALMASEARDKYHGTFARAR
jgi:hypothetical protein